MINHQTPGTIVTQNQPIESNIDIPKPDNKKIWIIILVFLIFILLTTFLLFFYINSKETNFSSENRISPTPIIPSESVVMSITPLPTITLEILPTAKASYTANLSTYTNDKLGFKILYPEGWSQNEEYGNDDYILRQEWKWLNLSHLPSDIYSQITLYHNDNALRPDVLDSINVRVYQNPNNLTLYNFFKGYRGLSGPEKKKDNPNDTFYSEEVIKKGINVVINDLSMTIVPDRSYSDLSNAKTRTYYLTIRNEIYEISFNYLSFEKSTPEKVEQLIQQIINSFSINSI